MMEGQKGITSLVDKILKRLKMLRFYPPEVVNFRGKLVYTVAVYFVVETVFVLVASWAQWTFDKRVAVIESLNFSLGVLYVATELFLLPDRTKLLVELIQSQPFLYQIPDRNMSAFYKQKRQLVVQLQEKRYKFATILESALKYSFINYLLPPIVSILLYLLHLQTLDQLTLPLVFYLPFTPSPAVAFTSIEQYILLTAIQVAFISYAALLAIIAHVTSFLAVDTVLTEMKLFHLNINDLQHLDAINLPSSQRSQTLSYLIRQITLHHQIICRLFFHKKVNMLRKGFEFQITYMNAFICLHLCLDIYYFLNGANFYKIKYGFLSITLIMVAYIYCENGQKLQQEGENLRLALYNCSWVGKPTWVHRTLLILMTRQNTPLTMRAFNVFTLNRHNLKMILQAAYSYLNLLSHLSK